jgi:DNA-directed RNA polymerase I, II, and III subunit RPABC3
MSSDSQLFLSTFTLDTSPSALETQKKARYDRVTRYTALSTDSGSVKLILDVNTDLYTLPPDTHFEVLLASTLNLDGSKDEGKSGGWREKQQGESDLSDGWEYVCYGKVYKFEEGEDGESM